MKMTSVTPKSVGIAIRSRRARYFGMRGPRVPGPLAAGSLLVDPERVDAAQLGEHADLARVALHPAPPHRQVIREADQVQGRGLVEQRHALGKQALALGLVGLAVDLPDQPVELGVREAREVERAARPEAHLPARPRV